MLLWDEHGKLSNDKITALENQIYGDNFPLGIRLHLGTYIDEKFSPLRPFTLGDPNHQAAAIKVAQDFMTEMDIKIASMPNDADKFLTRTKLQEQAEIVKQAYQANPLGLYINLRNCLEKEFQLVKQEAGISDTGTINSADTCEWIQQQILSLKQMVEETGLDLGRCRQEQEAFSVEYYNTKETIHKYRTHVAQHGELHSESVRIKASKEGMERNMKEKYFNLTNQRQNVINSIGNNLKAASEVQAHVLDVELINWKRSQQLAGNGYPVGGCLELLHQWCDGLADIIWEIRKQIIQFEKLLEMVNGHPQTSVNLSELMKSVTDLLSSLVTGTFVIEKQPPQVMKTNTRFSATVRLLVGGALTVHMISPSVSVSIVNEGQANHLLTTPASVTKRREDYNSGDILNGHGTMEYHAASKQISVSFRNLQLKKIKRTEKRGTESVMDEKFSILFWTEFVIGDLSFQLWTMSLPVVVIVHGNQEPQALATIIWDNAFAEWGRRPFIIPEMVVWGQLSYALNMKWAGACGSPLTDENLYYLACKALRNNNLPRNPDEYNNFVISWSMFCKETLPDRSFTFWEWFYRIYVLTSNQMSRLWKEGFIMGFVTKHTAESMLLQKQSGCFLLRFSDSELGGITIAYVRKPDPYQSPIVSMVAPFTLKDLAQRSMADVIFDLQELTVLYPDINKDVFKRFCSAVAQAPINRASDGYVKHTLVTQVEGGGFPTGIESNPSTPTPNVNYSSMEACHGPSMTPSPLSNYFGPGTSGLGNPGAEEMDMDENSVDVVGSIDVRQILGLSEDYL